MDEVGVGDAKTYRPLEANGRLLTGKYGVDSVGKGTSDTEYQVNILTGEGHWAGEWNVINDYTRPTETGTEVGEISADKNYFWNSLTWVLVAEHPEYADIFKVN